MGLSNMRRMYLYRGVVFCVLACCIFLGSGCMMVRPRASVESTVGVQALPPYSGPKARITVNEFKIKTDKATEKIGSGLRQMLITALTNSNRFSNYMSICLSTTI